MEATKKTTKKLGRYPNKKGINLIQNEEKQRNLLLTVLVCLLAIVLLEVALKYGMLDVYQKLNDATVAYDNAHVQYVAAQNQLRDYDDVLLEYRTYSMDWMEKDTSGKYVSVDRKDVLDLVESKMMRYGQVKSISVAGMNVNIEMTGLDLKEISQMCTDLETSPIVSSAVLISADTTKAEENANAAAEEETAETDEAAETAENEEDEGSILTFKLLIRLQRAEEKKEG